METSIPACCSLNLRSLFIGILFVVILSTCPRAMFRKLFPMRQEVRRLRVFQQAVLAGDSVRVRVFLETTEGQAAVNRRCIVEGNLEGLPALHLATRRCDDIILKLLLDVPGVNVNVSDAEGRTALASACEIGFLPVIRLLAEDRRVDVNCRDRKGLTPLWMAANCNHFNTVRWLLALRADVDLSVVPYELHSMRPWGRMRALDRARGLGVGHSRIANLLFDAMQDQPLCRANLRRRLLLNVSDAADGLLCLALLHEQHLKIAHRERHCSASRYWGILRQLHCDLQAHLLNITHDVPSPLITADKIEAAKTRMVSHFFRTNA